MILKSAQKELSVSGTRLCNGDVGFALVEFLVSAVILILASLAIFDALDAAQNVASCQVGIQDAVDNTRVGMDAVSRILRQAGNDPTGSGFEAITIVSDTQVRVRSDLVGSLGPGNPDNGDPDGDTDDSGEDIIVRYNPSTLSIELVPNGGPAQTIAGNITAFSLSYYDNTGAATQVGSEVNKITVSVTGTGTVPDPRTGRPFRIPLVGIIQLANRG